MAAPVPNNASRNKLYIAGGAPACAGSDRPIDPDQSVKQSTPLSVPADMAIHKRILEWQAAHPNITWVFWGIVWAIVLTMLFWPTPSR